MRIKLLRGDDEATVLLVHPATLDEYAGALGHARPRGAPHAGRLRRGHHRRAARPVGSCPTWPRPAGRGSSTRRRRSLCWPARPSPRRRASYLPVPPLRPRPPRSDRDGGPALAAIRALAASGAQVDQALATLDDAGLPDAVRQTLRRQVREALDSRSEGVGEALDRAEKTLALPWRTSEPQGFRPAASAAGAGPLPWRARAGQDAHPRRAGRLPADSRPAHRRTTPLRSDRGVPARRLSWPCARDRPRPRGPSSAWPGRAARESRRWPRP